MSLSTLEICLLQVGLYCSQGLLQTLAKALAHHFEAKLLLLDITDFSLKSLKRSISEVTLERMSSLIGSFSILPPRDDNADFKLGHYMKIPPRTMFMAQVVGTLIASLVYLGTAWWLMETIPDICETTSSVWTCPGDHVFYDASVIWGLIGPRKIFGDEGLMD
ncbi:Uncharacterized protein Fot_57373 [Forsythia ovata]|uniref:Uncharacterized protein n=1 Tax=Forsythia ovata TaxID=205694 RepID=A0ABD1NVK1_9LAMI